MHIIKRHTFLILAIVIVMGLYWFSHSNPAVAPNDVPPNVTYSPESELTDADLTAYAKSTFDQKAMMFKEITIGKHNGTPVLVTFPCSDVCPQATMRIIRYDVDATACEGAGGELKSILVPMAITVMPQEFCFPKPIVEAGVYEFVAPQT